MSFQTFPTTTGQDARYAFINILVIKLPVPVISSPGIFDVINGKGLGFVCECTVNNETQCSLIIDLH